MTPRTITGAHRIYVLPKERNKSEYVDYCAQSTTLVEALTKDSLVEHLIIKCSDPWGFVFPEQLVSQTEREKPLRITLLLTEHIDHVRGNLPHWEEFVARARTEGMLKGQVYKSGWQDCVVPRGVYVPSGLMTRIACRDKDKYPSNFPDPTKGGKQEDNFTYRFITDASLATGSTAEELAQIRAYFGVDLSHSFKPIRKIKNGIVTDTQADMWVYEFLYARQMIEAHGASSGVYMNMLYWLNASEANITDFWEVAEATEDTASKLEGKLDKPEGGSYVLDAEISDKIKDKVTNDKDLQAVIRGGMTTPQQVRDIIDKRKFVRRNLLLNTGAEREQKGLAAIYKFAYPIEREGLYALSFDFVTKYSPIGNRMKVIFGYQTSLQTIGYTEYWYPGMEHAKIRLNVKRSSQSTDKAESIYICPNDEIIDESTPGCGAFTIRNVKLEYGNSFTDWEPAPEDSPFEKLDTAKAALTYDIGRARSRADDARTLAEKSAKDIKDLKPNVPTEFEKDWLEKMGQVIKPNSKGSGNTFTIGGLSIDRSVFLRFSDGKPSALIGGQGGKGAVLMAGVQDYGTDNLSARMEIYQDGTARFGAVEMLFNGMRVKNDIMQLFNPTSVREPLLISDTQPQFVETLSQSSVENRNVVSGANVYLTNNTRTRQYNFSTSNPSTKLTITIERVRCEVYPQNSALEMLLDGVQIMSWRGNISYERVDGSDFAGGGVRLNIQKTPSEETNISMEYILPKGNHTLLLRNTSTDSTDKGTFYGLKCNLYYDASEGSTILSACGFRAYTNNSRYFDIDRRPKCDPTSPGSGDDLAPNGGVPNPYIARVKGGMRVDSLTLEQPLDAPGCVLAGGRVENSYVRASFGKYKNKRGDNQPRARFDNDDKIYSVYHSIDNTNYTPIVTSCAGAWGDVPQVIGVYAYRFDIRFINYNNEPSVGWNFNYVCYKGD